MAIESKDPVNDDSLVGVFNEVLRKFLQNTNDMLPAMVVDYDRAINRATVQPLIQLIDTDNMVYNRAAFTNIPVLKLGGGDFFVSFHLPQGSLGWIKANDRDLSLFLSTYVNNRPNTLRMHTFEDAIFIPDIMTDYTIAAEDEQAALIQNKTGTVRISLTDARIKLTAPQIEINAPDSVINATTSLTINSPQTKITGDSFEATTTTFTNNGVNVGSTHGHDQAPDSAGNTEQRVGVPS